MTTFPPGNHFCVTTLYPFTESVLFQRDRRLAGWLCHERLLAEIQQRRLLKHRPVRSF